MIAQKFFDLPPERAYITLGGGGGGMEWNKGGGGAALLSLFQLPGL